LRVRRHIFADVNDSPDRLDQEPARVDELRWRSLLRAAADGIIVIDAQGRIEAFNPGAERLFGHDRADVLGRNVSMLMPSPYREEHDHYIARYLTTGNARIIGIGREVVGLKRDGTTFPMHLSVGEMVIGGERKFTGLVHDLTQRKTLHDRLRTSEARWRSIVDSAVDAIITIDARGLVESFNPAAERLFGYTEADVIGRNVSMLMPAPFREEHDGYLARYLQSGEAKIIGIGREVTGVRKDGTVFPLHLSVGEMRDGDEKKFTGILHDLSARVRIEEQLREQESLVRLGEMAAVIAHEVRNPLAGIRGAMQVISGRMASDAPERAVTREIIGRIDALSELMQDLLLFARPPQLRPLSLDVRPLVLATAELLSSDPGLKDVKVTVDGTAPPVAGDPELLKIVFLNLLVNGAHAMQGRGDIRVSLRASENTCDIAFLDSGPGIPSDIRERIFTPFFTTKSRGTGLGLPTARRLVEAHRGRIMIECPPQGGTRVTVQLPLQ
jgi:two-component system sensor kinase FixL